MTIELAKAELPDSLLTIDSPPHQLYVRANQSPRQTLDDLMSRPRIAIVGSRLITTYGREITQRFTTELSARGVVVVSGLAFGVDAIAHHAAVEAGGTGIAVLPGSVDDVYPRSNRSLACRLLDNGGVLVSEYAANVPTFKSNFVARNRIVAGLADALLIIEAADRSGTLHTATFAMEQGIPVMAVPGNITSPTSVGTNRLIKTNAIAVTDTSDILFALGLHSTITPDSELRRIRGNNPEEQQLIDLLEKGLSDGDELLARSGLPVEKFNHHLTMLEITAKIRALGANHWALR